ncbi:MAG: hypothetical protein QOG33_2508 [Gaiellales bacterium]|jgi:hypothetical protein|nr:hypothetical protein [Gaiellales bacterium]
MVIALSAPATAAHACDCGAPAGPVIGGVGTTAPGGGDHFVALPGRGTTVLDVDASGSVQRWVTLPGSWGVPLVAGDGTTGGVSGDGRTLVLQSVSYRYPQRVTRFDVLGTGALRLRHTITLRGDFSFDAVSPDGSLLFLIEHPVPGGLANYLVRAYDVRHGRMLRRIIREVGEDSPAMNGTAVTRATTADGAWAYTLYDQGGGRMFVHALDTVRGVAHCVDLPRMSGIAGMQLTLSRDRSRLDVMRAGDRFVSIDTASFAVSRPSGVATASIASRTPASGGHVGWLLAGAVALAMAGALTLAVRRRGATLPAWRPRSD